MRDQTRQQKLDASYTHILAKEFFMVDRAEKIMAAITGLVILALGVTLWAGVL